MTWFATDGFHSTFCGTNEFIPPELLHDTISYEPQWVDPWAMGVLAIELVMHQSPFANILMVLDSGEAQANVWENIRLYRGDPFVRFGEGFDADYRDFCVRCLQIQPDTRMTMEEALEHPFLRPCRRPVLSNIQSLTVEQRCQLFEQRKR